MAVHPLRPAIHRCLGEPLPHRQANGPRAHHQTVASKERPPFTTESLDSVVLSGISPSFERLFQIWRQVAHVLLTRPPLYSPEGFLVRLACVRHAASVRSEPGSNSPIDIHMKRDAPKRKSDWLPRRNPHLFSFQSRILNWTRSKRFVPYSIFKDQSP